MELIVPWDADYLVDDRFSLLDSASDTVVFWAVVEDLLQKPTKSILDVISILETIHEYHERPYSSDFTFLKAFLYNYGETDFISVWTTTIVPAALSAPKLFQNHDSFPILQAGIVASARFTRDQMTSLLAHQFLCSFPTPSWYPDDRSPDFHIWYAELQPHAGAVTAYLRSLCEFFAAAPKLHAHPVTYRRLSLPEFSLERCVSITAPLCSLDIKILDEASTSPAYLGLPDGACVISANKDIGFGRSGTQEEVNVGASSAACPAVLLAPTLQDDEVFVIEGPKAEVTIRGYGRQARMDRIISQNESWRWENRTMLFMDALELDAYDGSAQVPDLLPGHLERELRKAYTAFSSSSAGTPYQEIVTGLWGCRSFCGDPQIKTLIQWVAASLASVSKVTFVLTEASTDFAATMKDLITRVEANGVTSGNVLKMLMSLKSNDLDGGRNAFAQI